MKSKKNHEGYLLIDNRAGPGITRDFVIKCGVDPNVVPIVGEGKVFEAATITCSHCQTVLIMNPERTRTRGFCLKCDHYICDNCEAQRVMTGECNLARKRHDKIQEQAFLYEQRGSILLR